MNKLTVALATATLGVTMCAAPASAATYYSRLDLATKYDTSQEAKLYCENWRTAAGLPDAAYRACERGESQVGFTARTAIAVYGSTSGYVKGQLSYSTGTWKLTLTPTRL